MARIAGVDLPRTKRIEVGLTYIYGIGRKRSNDVLGAAGVSPDIRVKDLSEDDVRTIELSFVRAHRRCSKEVSRVRTRRVDLSRLRY